MAFSARTTWSKASRWPSLSSGRCCWTYSPRSRELRRRSAQRARLLRWLERAVGWGSPNCCSVWPCSYRHMYSSSSSKAAFSSGCRPSSSCGRAGHARGQARSASSPRGGSGAGRAHRAWRALRRIRPGRQALAVLLPQGLGVGDLAHAEQHGEKTPQVGRRRPDGHVGDDLVPVPVVLEQAALKASLHIAGASGPRQRAHSAARRLAGAPA